MDLRSRRLALAVGFFLSAAIPFQYLPIDIRQRNLHALVAWNVNAGDSSHLLLQFRASSLKFSLRLKLETRNPLLALLLLMLGVFTTDNHYNSIAPNYLAVFTTRLYRGTYFHDLPSSFFIEENVIK